MFAPLRICRSYIIQSVSISSINTRLCLLFGTQSALQCNAQQHAIKSSLYFSSKEEVFSVVTPSFDVDYLKSVASNLEAIQRTMAMRGIDNFSIGEMQNDILAFAELSEKLNTLKKKRKKLFQKIRKNLLPESGGSSSHLDSLYEANKKELTATRQSFYKVESKVVPFLLNIPVQIRNDIGDCPQIIDQFDGFPSAVQESGAINYVRLGYINNIFHSSIVGPGAQFLVGDGAQAFYAVIDYVSDLFESAQYVPISGLDIVKSALVEAANNKEVHDDRFMIRDDHHQEQQENQRLHLTGDASIEAFCAWFCKLNDQPVGSKFIQVGSSYGKSLSQTHSVRATVLADSLSSDQSLEQLYSQWWKALTGLGLKCRSVRVEVGSLLAGESAKYQLSVWLHSKQNYLPVGEVTHHAHYLSQRLGLGQHQSKHLLSSSLDLVQLLKCLFEHYQDPATGKVNYPQCLTNYFL